MFASEFAHGQYFSLHGTRKISMANFLSRLSSRKKTNLRLFCDRLGQSDCSAIAPLSFHDARLHLPWIPHKQYVEVLKVKWAKIQDLGEFHTPIQISHEHMPKKPYSTPTPSATSPKMTPWYLEGQLEEMRTSRGIARSFCVWLNRCGVTIKIFRPNLAI